MLIKRKAIYISIHTNENKIGICMYMILIYVDQEKNNIGIYSNENTNISIDERKTIFVSAEMKYSLVALQSQTAFFILPQQCGDSNWMEMGEKTVRWRSKWPRTV